ncbi:RNase domain-containing protein [Salix suchowensis]|nr:RNase domain-containing protein [Salix suchowensis]
MHRHASSASSLLIWSDSLDAVSVFSSLSPSNAMHNAPLRAAAEIIISTGIDLKVQHIAGTDNIRADLLSRRMFNDYKGNSHQISFTPFTLLITFSLSHGGHSSEVVILTSSESSHQEAHSLERLGSASHIAPNSAVEKSTKKGYITGARDYISFCISHSLPLDPTPQTLARYIAFSSLYISSSSKYLSGARYFLIHIFPEFDQNRSHPFVRAAIRGSMKIRGSNISRKLPLRLHHLSTFLAMARKSKLYDDLLFVSMLSGGPFLSWFRYPVHTVSWHRCLSCHASCRIRSPERHQPRSSVCAFPARRWVSAYKTMVYCKAASSRQSRLGGHSARAGGATFYASLGLSEDIIQALGRWSSEAWKIYVRENPTIRAELQLAQHT